MTADHTARPDAERIRAALAAVSKDVAAAYEKTVEQLWQRPGFDEHGCTVFSEACLEIAQSGWRCIDSVSKLLVIAPQIDQQSRLLEIVVLGQRFSGYSYEPALRYLELVEAALSHGRDDIKLLETASLELLDQYPHATGLISSYFRAAGCLVTAVSLQERETWTQLVTRLRTAPREDLTQFLALSEQHPEVNWSVVGNIFAVNPGSGVTYLARYEALKQAFSGASLDAIDLLVIAFADADVDKLIAGLLVNAAQEAQTLSLLVELGHAFDSLPPFLALLEQFETLPLHRPDVVRAWLAEGMALAGHNEAALCAFVALESSRSRETLAGLRGQVAFADHRRTFDLIAEAVTGKKILIEASADKADTHQALLRDAKAALLPETDGSVVLLPETVNLYEDATKNFGFYKVALFHQLGYTEFGCFAAIRHIRDSLATYGDGVLAERIFQICEDARIDWRLAGQYPGLAPQLVLQKSLAANSRKASQTRRGRLLEALLMASLDAPLPAGFMASEVEVAEVLQQQLVSLRRLEASIADVLEVTRLCYRLIATQVKSASAKPGEADVMATLAELPEPVGYRGEMDVDQVESTLKIEAIVNELEDQLAADPDQNVPLQKMGSDQEQIELGDLKKGDVGEGVSMLLTELENQLELNEEDVKKIRDGGREGLLEMLGGLSSRSHSATTHVYDEWDYQIGDYRPDWCTLYEHRDLDEDEAYVRRTLVAHQDLSRRIRTHLNKIRPEMLRKVKGVSEGEELDLERSIAYLIDRKAGLTPDDNIYVQRQRKERDVSTMFLIDMSASTDDKVPDPDARPMDVPDIDDDEYLVEFFARQSQADATARRIIDLEKESVILMADALEHLGDAYSVCGFSGYGRDQVDYYLCKDFDEPFGPAARGRLGGITPCRSTRMGPPIRHATHRLLETGSRIKALIIISDGYPQDHDYGTDRNSRDYGLMDTMKALSEARQQGIVSYCLTVDPSGHDYLRAMCPDSQYMVISDLDQLPEELSRVYRSLTG